MRAYTFNEIIRLYESSVSLNDLKMSIKIGYAKTGTPFFYFDPKESTFLGPAFTDIYKKYNAKYGDIGGRKAWLWYIGKPENFPSKEAMEEQQRKIYSSYIIPFINEMSERIKKESNASDSECDARKQQLIKDIESAIEALKQVKQSPNLSQAAILGIDEIEAKLHGFVDDIINTFDDEEIIEKIEKIVQFQGSQGLPLSMNNIILTYVQDPEATMVQALGRWQRDLNRSVNSDVKQIALIRPETRKKSDKECSIITKAFLDKLKLNSVDQLDLEQKQSLERSLYYVLPGKYASYTACDIRFTTQIEGKDVKIDKKEIESPVYKNIQNREWRDLTRIDPNVKPLYNAGMAIAKHLGLRVVQKTEAQLGGSSGSSRGDGLISIIQNDGDNIGLCKTLFHEITHSILHQKYVQSDLFIGQRSGRGPVEQQAELTALLVMRSFGYNIPTSINYVKNWGGTKSSIVNIFKVISETTNYLVRSVDSIFNGGEPLDLDYGSKSKYALKRRLGESLEEHISQKEHEDITPYDVAEFIGMEDIFDDLENEKDGVI